MGLQSATRLCRLLGDPTRLRLLALLEQEELTVAELAATTRLAQPRVSTHLARLKEAGLVRTRRAGVNAWYALNPAAEAPVAGLWGQLRPLSDDPLIRDDLARLPGVLERRANGRGWADSVAGDMERHYSPGRTWEATVRALSRLLQVGDVLDVGAGDGVIAGLLVPQACSLTCLDISARVAAAGGERLGEYANTAYCQGDMHELPFRDTSFDLVLAMNALSCTANPEPLLTESFRVTRPGGGLLIVTLARHRYRDMVERYDYRNRGFEPGELGELLETAGYQVTSCDITSTEPRPPHFRVLTAVARVPA